LLAWWQKSRTAAPSATVNIRIRSKLDSASKQVLESCKQNDPQRVRQQLLEWGRAAWPANPPFSIGDISLRTSSEMAAEIHKLNDALYSKDSKAWSGDSLARVFASESARTVVEQKPVEQGRLEPLYRI
jgi:hypothetical protein